MGERETVTVRLRRPGQAGYVNLGLREWTQSKRRGDRVTVDFEGKLIEAMLEDWTLPPVKVRDTEPLPLVSLVAV